MTELYPILLADDDEADRMLTRKAFEEAKVANPILEVGDGEELMDYLLQRNKYQDPASSPRPCLILLDLNMPKKDGREALKQIKANTELAYIPIVILTTSKDEPDVTQAYNLGISSYIQKPATFEGLKKVVKSFSDYWFAVVFLPPHRKAS